MKHLVSLLAVVLMSPLVAPPVFAQSVEAQIAEAVLPLPADLRADATVATYDPHTGARNVLRQGTNIAECHSENSETGYTRCYRKVLVPRNDLTAKLRAEGKSGEEIQAAVAAAVEAGTIPPAPTGTMSYHLSRDDNRIKLLWVMEVPGATPESIDVSTVSQRDNALKGAGRPWLMRAGTPAAHIMIPINNTPLSNHAP